MLSTKDKLIVFVCPKMKIIRKIAEYNIFQATYTTSQKYLATLKFFYF